MKYEEVVVRIESPESQDAVLSNVLSEAAGTLEASSLAELGEESHDGGAEDEGKKKKKNQNKKSKGKKEFYKCRFCQKEFEQGQALGGHMNGHPEARNVEKMKHYAKLLEKMNPGSFRTVNPREYVSETSSHPFNNFNQSIDQVRFQSCKQGDTTMAALVGYSTITPMLPLQRPTTYVQQPPQQMDPCRAWLVNPQQFSWPQASTNDFTNVPTTYVVHDATVNGNYGPPPSMDSSMSGLTSQYNVPAPKSMSSTALYGNLAPCDLCKRVDAGTYQNPQMNMNSLHTTQQATNSTSTLHRNQPGLLIPPSMETNDSSSVHPAQSSFISVLDIQEMDVPQVKRMKPDPANAPEAESNPMFSQWSGNPTNHTF